VIETQQSRIIPHTTLKRRASTHSSHPAADGDGALGVKGFRLLEREPGVYLLPSMRSELLGGARI
jgi:hypothetical protein